MYGVCKLQDSVTKRLGESWLSRRTKGGPQLYILHLFKLTCGTVCYLVAFSVNGMFTGIGTHTHNLNKQINLTTKNVVN